MAGSQIDGDPIVGDRLVDPALEVTVAHFKKIIALQRAGRRNPMTHEDAEDLTANVFVRRSVRHKSTIAFAAPTYKPPIGLHHRLKRRCAKRNDGFCGSTSATKVAVNFKIGVQRVGLNLCKSGLGAAYRARV